jgi:carbonic anhydrase/acetyltransferase-like protein (isoleucine patch superfamily)
VRAATTILPFKGHRPVLADSSFIAPGATVIGDVVFADRSSLWYGGVVRGDVAPVRIGADTNIQDGAVVHVSRDKPEGTVIGSHVTIGHLALVHACTIEDECLIGMYACVMDGAVVEKNGWVAAGALIAPGKRVRSGELWSGVPAKPVRELRPEDIAMIRHSAELYVQNAIDHAAEVAVVV